MARELASALARSVEQDGITSVSIPRVRLLRASQPTPPCHAPQDPVVCVVAQGTKQVVLGEQTYTYGPGQFLIVSADLPVSASVTEASPDAPYLGISLSLDPVILSELIDTAHVAAELREPLTRGIEVATANPELLDALVRLVNLLGTERASDQQVLAPLAEREILYRLLTSELGGRLYQIAHAESKLSQINKAIGWIKGHYDKPIRVEEVASQVNMSVSSFHHHFRTVTSMSPLQYQKQLRLQEARRLMLVQALDAAAAGFMVGYQSPSQFSREYSRMFGMSPKKDVEHARRMN
ncbi:MULTISPECIES: AraC family transcriptional regulator [Leeia]|uniref:AraC family transcriptional regulator n=1 Tax=Leeia aquatica TaxID=2725557 RepID=A0A847SL18_9NEIS|nr:AraC family transcriptional regulator [Leeia aquatica]NLR76622.1 AraC family transcriptional regulator [Leeia aquatica]